MKADIGLVLRAPPGRWRVVEFVSHSAERIVEASDALATGMITPEEGDGIARGTYRALVGDYADFGEAGDQVFKVRYPYARRMYDDQGRFVYGSVPGTDSAPQSGSES